MPSGVFGNTSTNWTGRVPNGGAGTAIVPQVFADRRRQGVDHLQHHVEFARRLVVVQQVESGAELAEHVGVGSGVTDRLDDRPDEIQVDRAVGLREVVPFEEGRRRQHHVGIQRGVGHHLLEDHREEILPLRVP